MQLIALDEKGLELDRLDTTPTAVETGDARIADFIDRVSLPKLDARKNWEYTLMTARDTQRKVWVYIGDVGCVPCTKFGRWLDEHRALIERDYVVLKVDTGQDIEGKEVASELRAGVRSSIPYHAIFNFAGDKLIDSIGPDGNIGFPADDSDIEHFRQMLSSTADELTSADVDALIKSLEGS